SHCDRPTFALHASATRRLKSPHPNLLPQGEGTAPSKRLQRHATCEPPPLPSILSRWERRTRKRQGGQLFNSLLRRRRGQKIIRGVRHTIFHHTLNIRGVRDVVGWIRVQNNEIGEISLFDSANVRAGCAAEQLRGIRSSRLQNLHRRQPGFLH